MGVLRALPYTLFADKKSTPVHIAYRLMDNPQSIPMLSMSFYLKRRPTWTIAFQQIGNTIEFRTPIPKLNAIIDFIGRGHMQLMMNQFSGKEFSICMTDK